MSSNFAPKVDFAASTEALNMAMGDLDDDGKSDLVTVNFSANTISVLRNTSTSGSVSFAAKVDVATNTNPRGIAIGDLDGDGKPEVVITNFNSNNVSIYRNTSTSGSISFAAKVDFATGTGPRSVTISDFDGDGKPDLAIAHSGNVMSVLRNISTSGSLSFLPKIDFALTAGNSSVAINSVDIDGDGKIDIAIINNGLNTVSVFRNISAIGVIDASSFATKVDFATGVSPFSLSNGDLDGDNKPDLAIANFSGQSISVLRNNTTNGNISFEPKVDFEMGGTTSSTNIADINGDGKLDLLGLNLTNNQVSIFQNTATSGSISAASFAPKIDFTTATGPRFVCIGDLDGDNRPDLAVTTQTSNVVSVLRYVEVISNPTVPTTQTTCSGNTASLSATCAVGTVNWYNYLNVAIPFVGSPFVTPVINANSLYKVRCEGLTTSAFVDVWVTVNPKPTAPTITASGPTTFCNSGSVTLNSNMGNNNALSFAKVNSQYVTVPHSASLNLSTSFTMEAWVNYSGSNVTILDKGNYDYLWSLNANGNGNKMGFYERSTGTWKYSNDPVPQNTWTHVAIMLTGNTIFFFINGLPSGAASMTISQDNQPLNIGRQQPTFCACNHFNGTMDELRIWNVARTYEEIIDNRNNTVPTNSAGLGAYYKFDEGTGSTTADASGNGNNGTLVNAPTWQVPSTSPVNAVVWLPGGATTPTIVATNVGTYTATVTNGYGCTYSGSITIINSVSPIPTPQGNTSIPTGGSISLTATGCSGNSGTYILKWYKASDNTLATMPVSPTTTTSYYAKCEQTFNGITCISANSANVAVNVGNFINSTLSGNWESTNTWTPSQVPLPTDIVIINNHTVTITSNAANAKSLEYKSGATLRYLNATAKLNVGF